MQLSRSTISKIKARDGLIIPPLNVFDLPEKVLQFGTGVLLRGLPDHFINIANRQGVFNGRIVVVKSTSTGDTDAYSKQDGLYSLAVRGVENGNKIAFDEIIASISRVLSAQTEWEEVLQCAGNPHMELIISNTTEMGIVMQKDNVHASPPQTFPGKLLAFLYHRYKLFNADPEKGMVIIPTELIPGNADTLLSIVLEQAHIHGLEIAFIEWLENCNHFCNSLVDRIVPGKFNQELQQENQERSGYTDDLMIMSEQYALWAIQTDSQKVKSVLSFADVNPQVLLAHDIEKFKELKVRLLNGSHTFTCGLAVLAGFRTVKEAMADEAFNSLITRLMLEEIVPAIESDSIDKNEAEAFAYKVLDRYRNIFIEHQWHSICVNASSKMLLRNRSLLYDFVEKKSTTPVLMSLGMASHILFMRSQKQEDGNYYGDNGSPYLVSDPNAAWYANAWDESGPEKIVEEVLANKNLWLTNLNGLAGFTHEVNYWLQQLLEKGAQQTLENIHTKTPVE